MRKYMTFGVVLLTVFLIIAISYVNSISSATPPSDILYIDLRAFPTYVKNGFDLSAAEIIDPSLVEWDLTLPPHSGEVKMSKLPVPEYAERYHSFSIADRKIEEFTILIPFMISDEQYQNLNSGKFIQPGLYFAGIGENWEVYINGQTVASEIYLNENSEITKFQSKRGVTISFDRQYLKNGSNSLVIRIVGARSSKWTGLIHGSPYYLTDYDYIKYNTDSIESVVMFTICAFLGLYHTLLFFFRRTDRYNLLFAGYAIMFGIYLLTRYPVIYQIISNTKYVQYVEYGALYLFTFLLSAFIETLNLGKITRITLIYGSFCLILSIIQFFFPIWFAYSLLLVWQASIIVYMIYTLSYVVIGAMVKQVITLRNVKRAEGVECSFWNIFIKSIVNTESGNIFLLIILIISVGIFDVLDAAVIHIQAGISLSMSAFLGFLLCMAYILAQKYANRYETTAQMNEALEGLVKQRTAELERQIHIADAASHSKSSFLSRTSHEIRTPMNAIIGMAELALREEIPVSAYEHIQTIKQASANLLSIINDILDFSKIESGKLEIATANYLFSSLINDVVSIIRMRAMDKHVRFVTNIDCKIPNAMLGDEIRIRQILLNLLSNAVKYTDEGFVSLYAIAEITDETTAVLTIEVSDSGRGIKESDIDKLFGEFVQLDFDKNKGIEGTGLGLAITKNLINAMGGEISVYSQYGKGTTFTVTLPQKFRDYKELASVNNPADKSVLIYERREAYANSIVRTIINLGIDCALVTNDLDFYDKLSTNAYSFVFVSSFLLQNAKRVIAKLGTDPKMVLLTEFGEVISKQNLCVLSMPVFSVSVANMLNGAADVFTFNENHEIVTRFVAPTAKILIVDDINTNLKVAEGLMLPYGAQIDLCKSGADAIEAVKSNRYDIVFMDHMMHGMDGIEATQIIRVLDPEDPYYKSVPIIALTANAMSGMKEVFIENGFDDYLAKPIEIIRLNEIMSRWIPLEKRERAADAKKRLANEYSNALEIEGIDIRLGLSMFGDSEERYREVLSLYCRDAEERLDAFNKSPTESNLTFFVTQVHALKSASASIGACELSEQAAFLENACNRGDMTAIWEQLVEFRTALSTLIERIRAVIPYDRADITENAAVNTKALLRLKNALESEDVVMIDTMLDVLTRDANSTYVKSRLNAVSECVLMSELTGAIDIINDLLGRAVDE